MSEQDITALLLSIKLAGLSTAILLVLGMPLAWWLAHTKARWRFIIEALVALPLVLPPTVLGFYLLLSFSPNSFVGAQLTELVGAPIAFSFTGLVIGSIVYSLPFVVQPLHNAFIGVGRWPLEAAAVLGAGPLDRFISLVLPLSRAGILSAAILGFAHTLGEFGVVLMIGGNIPAETQVASIAIYEHVETLQFDQANRLSLVLLGLSFVLLSIVYALGKSRRGLRL